MKIILIVFFSASIVGLVDAQDICKCEELESFKSSSGKCEQWPQEQGNEGHIPNCIQYKVSQSNDSWVCLLCQPRYSLENGECNDRGVENCIIYDGSSSNNRCIQCQGGYYDKNGVCEKNPDTDPNCKVYGVLPVSKRVVCHICSDGMHAGENNVCVQSPSIVTGCKRYIQGGNQIECIMCTDEYDGINDQECFKIKDKIRGCINGYVSNGIYRCNKCQSGKMLVDKNGTSQDECAQNPQTQQEGKIENCMVYQKNYQGNVLCYRCQDHYYYSVQNNTCNKTSQEVSGCGEYNGDGSACNSCKDSFYAGEKSQYGTVTKCKQCPVKLGQNSQGNMLQVGILVAFFYMILAI